MHLRGVTRWESGILNYELVFGECFRFIIGEIPAWPRIRMAIMGRNYYPRAYILVPIALFVSLSRRGLGTRKAPPTKRNKKGDGDEIDAHTELDT